MFREGARRTSQGVGPHEQRRDGRGAQRTTNQGEDHMTVVTDAPIEPAGGGAQAGCRRSRAVADPAPLGLAAFAMTTLALSLFNANIWPAAVFPALALALVYGGSAQLLAGMWEFARKNTFGALAFTSYGAFWISYYVFVHFVAPAIKVGPLPTAVGRVPARLDYLHLLPDHRLDAGLRCSAGRVRRADHHLCAPDHRCLPVEPVHHQGRWLGRRCHAAASPSTPQQPG